MSHNHVPTLPRPVAKLGFWSAILSAMLAAAWVFRSTGRERWVRWLFIVVGITAPFQFVGVLFQLGLAMGAPAGLIWSLATPAACFLIALLFKQAERDRQWGELPGIPVHMV